MKNLIGAGIGIYLKGGDRHSPDLSGILSDIDDRHIYIQGNSVSDVFVVPRDNVSYYTTNRLPSNHGSIIVQTQPYGQVDAEKEIVYEVEDLSHNRPEYAEIYDICENEINVYVDEEIVGVIPVDPSFNLTVWHDDIMRLVMSDKATSQALQGRVQTSMEYLPINSGGEVYIHTRLEDIPEVVRDTVSNSFSMSGAGGGAANQYLNPGDMVSMLNNVVRKKNDK